MLDYISHIAVKECTVHLYHRYCLALKNENFATMLKNPDDLTDELRIILGDIIIFINVYHKEYNKKLIREEHAYTSYARFFNIILDRIYLSEENQDIANVAWKLLQQLEKISQYLGAYSITEKFFSKHLHDSKVFDDIFTSMMIYRIYSPYLNVIQ